MKYMFIVGVVSANSRQFVNIPVYRYSFMFLMLWLIFCFTSFFYRYFSNLTFIPTIIIPNFLPYPLYILFFYFFVCCTIRKISFFLRLIHVFATFKNYFDQIVFPNLFYKTNL